jgi:hypothetical protein
MPRANQQTGKTTTPKVSQALTVSPTAHLQAAQAMGEHLTDTLETAQDNLDEFEQAELRAARALGIRKAIAIASFQTLVDQAALEHLARIRELQAQSTQAMFAVEFDGWVNEWSDAVLIGDSSATKQIEGGQ